VINRIITCSPRRFLTVARRLHLTHVANTKEETEVEMVTSRRIVPARRETVRPPVKPRGYSDNTSNAWRLRNEKA
jgi:hypothetical protein